jgi:hypothetical protein
LEREPSIHVHFGDRDDKAKVGPRHVLPRLRIAALDSARELLFLLRVEQGGLVDLEEIRF